MYSVDVSYYHGYLVNVTHVIQSKERKPSANCKILFNNRFYTIADLRDNFVAGISVTHCVIKFWAYCATWQNPTEPFLSMSLSLSLHQQKSVKYYDQCLKMFENDLKILS